MLFRPNIASPGQVAALVAALRGAAPGDCRCWCRSIRRGAWCSGCAPRRPSGRRCCRWAAAGTPRARPAVGRALGEELAALGIGWNFAPVLDVHTNPANPVIGNRAFGTTPEAVARQALAFWRGLRGAGLVGCGKHFPGHGDTRTDSHHELPVVAHDVDRLRAVELAPFAAAARAGMEAFMTAHVLYPALDPDRPATLSRRIATDLLRGELGFRGVLVSDDLGMKAVADRYPIEELAVGAIEAGVDHLKVIDARLDRAHRQLLDRIPVGDRLHAEVVGHQHAAKAELAAQQLGRDPARQRRRPVGVQRRIEHVRGHERLHAGGAPPPRTAPAPRRAADRRRARRPAARGASRSRVSPCPG